MITVYTFYLLDHKNVPVVWHSTPYKTSKACFYFGKLAVENCPPAQGFRVIKHEVLLSEVEELIKKKRG
jgi:hypothetical protein